MKKIYQKIFIAGIISLLAYIVTIEYNEVMFNRNCGGLLKRAADANAPEMAKEQLGIAVKYCEDNELTHGYTSVLYETPDEDIGFWYQNLKKSLAGLDSISSNTDRLVKSNVLMQLRETLLDTDDKGKTVVTCPKGISRYPNNMLYGIWAAISLLAVIISRFGIFVGKRYSSWTPSKLDQFKKSEMYKRSRS